MVSATLTAIENWYEDTTDNQEKLILLSKLAILEFCGWLEEWMDNVIREVDRASLKDANWIERSLIGSTHGFHYDKHFRVMLCGILGEHKIRQIESKFDASNPGDLDGIKSDLGNLWKTRCKLAHSDLAAHKNAQINVNAPSWTKNQFRITSKRLEAFKECILINVSS